MKLSPYVNVDVKMSKDILEALTMHEFYCIGSKIKEVTPESVREFLLARYSKKIADKFKPEYLFNILVT
jgi:hypothetical protein